MNWKNKMAKKNILQSAIALFMVLLGTVSCMAQSGRYTTTDKKEESLYEEGFTLSRKGDYSGAQKALSKAVDRDPNFREAYMLLGNVYASLSQFDQAITSFKTAYQLDPQRGYKAILYMAELERQIGKYGDAVKHYEEYLKYVNDPEGIALTRRNIERSIVADSLQKNPISFNPQNLGPEINTSEGEYGPTVRADEQTLIFTRRGKFPNPSCNTGNGQTEELFISQKNNGAWSKALNMGQPLNTNCNEGAQSISADGQLMFFAAIGRTVNGRIYETSDIYWSRRKGNSWETPKNMGGTINTGAWESQPSISSDGKTLYFVSTKPGGYGDADIYSSTLNDDGTWSKPQNLGPEINTPGKEFSPFIHPDNQTLYFASDYLPGLGGFDLFYTRKNAAGKFQKPVNLGMPLNTKDDEYSLVVSADGKTGYFASNTLKGYGDYDLYAFEMSESARPVTVNYMKGIVTDAVTKKNLEATFELIDLVTGETFIKSTSDAITGEFLVSIPANKNYALNVSKNGYLFHSENFTIKESKQKEPYVKNVELTPVSVGTAVVLRNVFFETGSAELKTESTTELNKLVDLLKKNPSMKIEISGHTDNVGSKESNLKLSDNRSKSVSTYLISKGIEAGRLTNKGFGDSKPMDTNETEQGRANNRRTEFKVTSI
jgi:outer membrane protein OmpA-like peptidoglycan-associated protein/tetratricopeptide (TPR) repeat protein